MTSLWRLLVVTHYHCGWSKVLNTRKESKVNSLPSPPSCSWTHLLSVSCFHEWSLWKWGPCLVGWKYIKFWKELKPITFYRYLVATCTQSVCYFQHFNELEEKCWPHLECFISFWLPSPLASFTRSSAGTLSASRFFLWSFPKPPKLPPLSQRLLIAEVFRRQY